MRVYLITFFFLHISVFNILCIHESLRLTTLLVFFCSYLLSFNYRYLLIYLFIHLFIYIFLYINLIYIRIYLFIYLPIHLFIYLFIYMFIYLHIFIHLTVYVFICPFIYLFTCLLFSSGPSLILLPPSTFSTPPSFSARGKVSVPSGEVSLSLLTLR